MSVIDRTQIFSLEPWLIPAFTYIARGPLWYTTSKTSFLVFLMSRISCIIVSYNNKRHLAQAIHSVLSQSLRPDEIIVADDGSTDGSRDLIKSLANSYTSVRPIFREHTLGVAANRDLAVRAASGDLVTTLDGDDYYFNNKIESEYMAIKNGADIAFSTTILIDINNKILRHLDLAGFPLHNPKDRIAYIAYRKGAIPRDLMLYKKIFIECGGFDHSLATHEDWDLKIRLSPAPYKWEYTKARGTAYRRTGLGLSNSALRLRINNQSQVLKKNRQLIIYCLGVFGFFHAIYGLGKWALRASKMGLIDNNK